MCSARLFIILMRCTIKIGAKLSWFEEMYIVKGKY